MVSIVPLWAGYVLATHELAPTSAGAAVDVSVALLVMGPLAWGAALAINDVADLPSDRRNPRKVGSPLVRGALPPTWAHRAAYGCAAVAVVASAWLGPTFAMLTLAFLVLAWAYSLRPLRLKNRPGADLLVNAVGVGLIPVLAGWALAQPLASFPPWFIPQPLLVAAALYVPTTLVDYDADLAAGEQTLATRLGRSQAYRVGWVAWISANVGVLVLGAADYVIPRSILPLLAICTPVLLGQYHWLIGRARAPAAMIRGIVILSFTFLIPSSAFAIAYVRL